MPEKTTSKKRVATLAGSEDRFHFERVFLADGHTYVAGVDEVGVGCLAGPVVAAAVILPLEGFPPDIDDSKRVSEKRRGPLAEAIRRCAVSWSVAFATAEEIDTLNILRAAHLAMERAVNALTPQPSALLIDGRFPLKLSFTQNALIGGDRRSFSIGAASIIAKVHRDEWMCRYDSEYPGYGFSDHKGYGSRAHREKLVALGPSPIHRKSFQWKPV